MVGKVEIIMRKKWEQQNDKEGNDVKIEKGVRIAVVFFFKQKTAYEMCGRDWSSDVCSSDLILPEAEVLRQM